MDPRQSATAVTAAKPQSPDIAPMQFENSVLGLSSVSSLSGDDIDSMSTTQLLQQLSIVDEELLLNQHGYERCGKLCDTLQGEMFKAQHLESRQYVAVKRTPRKSVEQQECTDEHGFNFCVSENILKEASMLQYLTVQNQSTGDYIVQFIDFFESDAYFYLVMEYVDGITLRQFVNQCKHYIARGQLSMTAYQKHIKFVLWQLCFTVQWMHRSHCCHLDLCLDNVMLSSNPFVIANDGQVQISSRSHIKVLDFGVAEFFSTTSFACDKQGLSIDNGAYVAPNVFAEEVYDARAADNWSLGIILFECLTCNRSLYAPFDVAPVKKNGYLALHLGSNGLKQHLKRARLLRFFSQSSLDLLARLLAVDEQQRLSGLEILQHKYFAMYYRKYATQVQQKLLQKPKLCVSHAS